MLSQEVLMDLEQAAKFAPAELATGTRAAFVLQLLAENEELRQAACEIDDLEKVMALQISDLESVVADLQTENNALREEIESLNEELCELC